MSKVRFWCVLSAAVAVGACATSGPGERSAGRPSAKRAETVAQTPQPEEPPCADCRLAVTGRVTGAWQKALCVSDAVDAPGEGPFPDVVFPVSHPRIEVLDGEGAGKEFAVRSEGETFEPGEVFEGDLEEGAAAETWTRAVLWVDDAQGQRCGSLLAIDK